jgi:hypothetical protein
MRCTTRLLGLSASAPAGFGVLGIAQAGAVAPAGSTGRTGIPTNVITATIAIPRRSTIFTFPGSASRDSGPTSLPAIHEVVPTRPHPGVQLFPSAVKAACSAALRLEHGKDVPGPATTVKEDGVVPVI